MDEGARRLMGREVTVYTLDAAVVGAGCAGLAAADRLYRYGRTDIAVIAEDVRGGTSRNAGSDKQTYYKLTLSGDEPDSVGQMAQTLCEGGAVDGDHALCEAALSAPCFLRLCDLGVPFPTNRYGEYVGYKTDHDPRRRATSAGPLTSRMMAEALENAVRAKGIRVFDRCKVVAILTHEGRALGLLCLRGGDAPARWAVFYCAHIVYATGGPAGIYADSCYPESQTGASGAALAAGARGKNLTEWQYGLASVRPRWNVSGTYMQALPRFVSADADGRNAREFLPDYLPDAGRLLTSVFLKGYQWPFDARKALDGSSVIDLCVYAETKGKGRRVFLDYRQNPLGDRFDWGALSPEALDYLRRSGALLGSPIERLRRMNAPAIAFYQSHGVDLAAQPLEIALCSQHSNGGVAVDRWWQSDVRGLFVVGEAAATHGVYRPGGSALNAGQAGAERAARLIAAQSAARPDADELWRRTASQIEEALALADGARGDASNIEALTRQARQDMSRDAAAVRDASAVRALLATTRERLRRFADEARIREDGELEALFALRDLLRTQCAELAAMADYADRGGKSRGSAIYTDPLGQKALDALPERCRFTPDDGALARQVQETRLSPDGETACEWRPARPLPREDDFFENVWREYRRDGNVR